MRDWAQTWLPSESSQILLYGAASAVLVLATWGAASFRSRAWNPHVQLTSEEVGLILRGPSGAIDAALGELLLQGAFEFEPPFDRLVGVYSGGRTALQQACAEAMRTFSARSAEHLPAVKHAIDLQYKSLAARGVGARSQGTDVVQWLTWLVGLVNVIAFAIGWLGESALFAVAFVGVFVTSGLTRRCGTTHKAIRDRVREMASASLLNGQGAFVVNGPVIGARVAIDSALWGPRRTLFAMEPAITYHRIERPSNDGGG